MRAPETSFRQVNASAYRVARLHPAKAHEPAKQLVVEPVLAAWLGNASASRRSLLVDELLDERDEDVRRPEVAVELRDLVFENQMVSERVPGQLAGEPMILMEIAAGVREDDVGSDRASGPRIRPSPRSPT